jgi:hypothetical protein
LPYPEKGCADVDDRASLGTWPVCADIEDRGQLDAIASVPTSIGVLAIMDCGARVNDIWDLGRPVGVDGSVPGVTRGKQTYYTTRFQDFNTGTGGGLSGTNTLNFGTTVQDNGASNTLTGAASAPALDWFFGGMKDTLINYVPGEHRNNT